MDDKSWLYLLLVTAAPAALGAVTPVVNGEKISAENVRRSYFLSGIFVLGMGTAFAVVEGKPEFLYISLAVFLAQIAAQEWALAIRGVEKERQNGETTQR